MEDQLKMVTSNSALPFITTGQAIVGEMTTMNSGSISSPIKQISRDAIDGNNSDVGEVSATIYDLSVIQDLFYDKWESEGLSNEETDENWKDVLDILCNRSTKEYSGRELCGKEFIISCGLPSLPDLIEQSAKDYMKRNGVADSAIEISLRRLHGCFLHNSEDSLTHEYTSENSGIPVIALYLEKQYIEKLISIGEMLYIGSECITYNVVINGVPMVLRIYENMRKDDKEKVLRLIARGRPYDAFWWPEGVLSLWGTTIGVLFKRMPDSYINLQEIYMKGTKEISLRRMIRACIELSTALRVLHSQGELYNELETDKIYIDAESGRVLIDFCKNISLYAVTNESSIIRSFIFTAPNVLRDMTHYDVMAERYAIAVIFFYMLFGIYPIALRPRNEGEPADYEVMIRQYVTNPIFVFDPSQVRDDDCISEHTDSYFRWNSTPIYIQRLFIAQFQKTNLIMSPERRAMESRWQEAFARYLSDIWDCPQCGKTNSRVGTRLICNKCGRESVISNYIISPRVDYKLPIIEGLIIYRFQLLATDIDSSNDILLYIRRIHAEEETLCIQNVSDDIIEVEMSDGREYRIQKGRAFKVLPNLTIKIGSMTCGEIV